MTNPTKAGADGANPSDLLEARQYLANLARAIHAADYPDFDMCDDFEADATEYFLNGYCHHGTPFVETCRDCETQYYAKPTTPGLAGEVQQANEND